MDTIKTRKIKQDWLFPLVNTIFLILLMFITLYPVINTIAYSFNDGIDALRGNIGLLPRKFSLESYKSILSDKSVFLAAWISASKTVLITILNLFWTSMLAYALSRKEFVFRKLFTVIMVLTMYVNAGLIPNYLLISKTLNLRNNYLVYIIPTMFSCFNMIVIRTYISNLPDALIESARIDGAGDFRIFWQIIFPLCKPVLATVALFVAVGSWNSWFDTYLYNGGDHAAERQRRQSDGGRDLDARPDHTGHDPLRDHGHRRGPDHHRVPLPAEILRHGHRARQRQGMIPLPEDKQ